ncbi:MAG: hypothetical protein JXR03_19725 [Cyclobacteriaceae bacterium]
MQQPKKTKRKLIAIKIYFDRARMYLGYINFFMLNMVLINSFDNPVLAEYISRYKWLMIPVLFVVYLLILIFIGYLDTRLGLRQEEMRNNATTNPVMQDLLRTVKDIQKKVNELGIQEKSDTYNP